MRTAAQADMVLDESSEGEPVISYLSELVQRVESQQAEQQRIVQHQTFLNLPRMVNEELALAKEEVSSLSFPMLSHRGLHCWVQTVPHDIPFDSNRLTRIIAYLDWLDVDAQLSGPMSPGSPCRMCLLPSQAAAAVTLPAPRALTL